MYSTLTSAALLGLSAIAAARPAPYAWTSTSTTTSATSYSTGSSSSSSTGQQAFDFPLSNGFPNVSTAVTGQIEQQAGGTLSNASAPNTTSADTQLSLGFIAFNELFEVAFFTELIANITGNVQGYTPDVVPNRDEVLSVLNTHLAQEELHVLNANGAFKKFTGMTIQPCEYIFPVQTFNESIGLAAMFTDVVLSTLPDIQTIFGTNGDNGLIRGVGSVIGQEGEQDGFYRGILGKPQAQLPFLTAGARDFAFSAIVQNFVVPGSCPSQNVFTDPQVKGAQPLKLFEVLNVLTSPSEFTISQDITAEFSIQTQTSVHPETGAQSFAVQQQQSGLYMTYINQQNVPVSIPIGDNFSVASGNQLSFTVSFPGQSHFLNGLTIAAVTSTNVFPGGVDDVANATLFGPGLIEIN